MDHITAMRTFVRVVQTGSFSASAREINTSQATISKRVAALEDRLGVQLLRRSSRDNSLTDAGANYYEKCVAILDEFDEAEASARSEVARAKGVLRVAVPTVLGRVFIGPLVGDFMSQHPELKLDLILTNRHVDLVAEGFDVAIRDQGSGNDTLVARKLFDNSMVLAASPAYLDRATTPESPQDLTEHNCIIYSETSSKNVWNFRHEDQDFSVRVNGNLRCNTGDVILKAALGGLGLALLPYWRIHQYVKADQLRIVIPGYTPSPFPCHVVYPQRRYLPLKVRCFIDYVAKRVARDPMFRKGLT